MILIHDIALPSGLLWEDEFAQSMQEMKFVRRHDGGLVLYPKALYGGRPITLVASENHWIKRHEAESLAQLALNVGETYQLLLRGQEYLVAFNHGQGPPLRLKPLIDYEDPDPEDPIIGSIHLITLQ